MNAVTRFFLLSVVRMTKQSFVIGEFCSHSAKLANDLDFVIVLLYIRTPSASLVPLREEGQFLFVPA